MKSNTAPACSPLERVKLAAQLLTKVREIGATPAGALHGAVDSTAVIRRAKLASEVNTLMAVVHAQPSAVRTLSGGYVVSSYRLDAIDAMPAAESFGAGKANQPWHAPVDMAGRRRVWTNLEIMLLGTEAPYPEMDAGLMAGKVVKGQADTAMMATVFNRADWGSTNVVQDIFAVRDSATDEAFVAMISGDFVLTVKRVNLALAQNWCGRGYRMTMGDACGMVYLKSADGLKHAVISPRQMSYTADQVRGGGVAVKAAAPAAKKPTVAPVIKAQVATEKVATQATNTKGTDLTRAALVLDTIDARTDLVVRPSRDADISLRQTAQLLDGMDAMMGRMACIVEAQSKVIAQFASQPLRPLEVTLHQAPANFQLNMPQQLPPVVHITNEVPAAQVVVASPARSVAEVQRDPRTQEILRTVTTHEIDVPGLS